MKLGSTVTSIWRVTARYIDQAFQNPTAFSSEARSRIIAKIGAGTNLGAGLNRARGRSVPSLFQHSFALRRTGAVPIPRLVTGLSCRSAGGYDRLCRVDLRKFRCQ